MASQIQLRRDTAANWTSANPTLAEGELAYETDTLKEKLGDGTTAWNSLAYRSNTGLQNFEFACSDETTDLAIGTVYEHRLTRSLTNVQSVEFGVVTAPTGAEMQIDVKKNSTTIYTTVATIDVSEFTTLTASVPQVLDGTINFVAGDLLSVVIDQVGSTVTGKNLKANLIHF